MKIQANNLDVLEDWQLGASTSSAAGGSHKIYMFNNKFLYISGALYQSNYEAIPALGAIIAVDKTT